MEKPGRVFRQGGTSETSEGRQQRKGWGGEASNCSSRWPTREIRPSEAGPVTGWEQPGGSRASVLMGW